MNPVYILKKPVKWGGHNKLGGLENEISKNFQNRSKEPNLTLQTKYLQAIYLSLLVRV